MSLDFQRDYWESRLRHPDWYNHLEDDLKRLFFPVVHHNAELKAFRNQVYALIAELLERDEMPLAAAGPDLDTERQLVDTIVVHHTEEDPSISLSRLSAIGLVRQYAFQYLTNNVLGHAVRGQPVWSGHFRQGHMVFFAYHWLIRPDGTAERLLEDGAIGWHAGNWAINTRCIGLALSGNYETTTPPIGQIEAAAQIIRTHYSQVPQARIVGHREVCEGISCPGSGFLGGWKDVLLERL